MKAIAKLIRWFLILCLLAFLFIPGVKKTLKRGTAMKEIEERDIDTSALYYTDSEDYGNIGIDR